MTRLQTWKLVAAVGVIAVWTVLSTPRPREILHEDPDPEPTPASVGRPMISQIVAYEGRVSARGRDHRGVPWTYDERTQTYRSEDGTVCHFANGERVCVTERGKKPGPV